MKLYRLRIIGFVGTDRDYEYLQKRFAVGLDQFLPTRQEWEANCTVNAQQFLKSRYKTLKRARQAKNDARIYFHFDFVIEEADVIWIRSTESSLIMI